MPGNVPALISDSEANNQFTRMLKELNLSTLDVAVWWADAVIVNITDSPACSLKDRGEQPPSELSVCAWVNLRVWSECIRHVSAELFSPC